MRLSNICWCFWLLACLHVQADGPAADIYLVDPPPDRSGCSYDPRPALFEIESWELIVRPLGKFTPDIGSHIVRNDLNNGHDEFLGMKVLTLTDGSERLLTGGYSTNGIHRKEPDTVDSGEDFLLARFYPFGFPDPAFGREGKVVMDFFRNNDRVWDILPLNDGSGRFLVAGSAYNAASTGGQSTGKDMVIMQFFEDGEVDTGFGQAGQVVRDFRQEDDEIYALALTQQNGNPLILAVGYGTHVINENSDRDAVLMGLTLAGEPALHCSGDGVQAWDNNGRDDELRTVTVLPLSENNQRIIAGGYTTLSRNRKDFLLAGFSPDCELDSGFSDDGIVRWGSDEFNTIWAVRTTTHNNNARILVAGIYKELNKYPDALLVLYRYLPDGSLDNSFGHEGKTEARVRYPDDTPVTLEVVYDNHNNASIMVGKYATMDCYEDRNINTLLSYHLNGSRTEYGMDFKRFGEGEAAIRAIVNITGSDGRRQLVVAGYGFGATSVGCGCSTQRDTILAGFMATREPDYCFSASETLLRSRPECASLLPEMFPTGEPATPMATPTATPAETVTVTVTVTPTPATMTAVNTVDEGQSPECAVQVAALSSVMGVCLLGNVVLGITTGLFCALHVSGSSKLKFSFRK